MNSLSNISWTAYDASIPEMVTQLPVTLQPDEMQNAIAQTAAAFLWLGMHAIKFLKLFIYFYYA